MHITSISSSNGVSLVMRPDKILEVGSEITISYGDVKSEAEMLFSYGFIDEQSIRKSLVLTLEPFPDDPLGKAKAAAFRGPTCPSNIHRTRRRSMGMPFLVLHVTQRRGWS